MVRFMVLAIVVLLAQAAVAAGPLRGPAVRTADVIFVVDGSGSVSAPAFRLQLDAIRNCVCAPGAPLRLDGSVAVGVVQFSRHARVEVPLTVLDGPDAADAFCDAVDTIVRLNGSTRLLPGLAHAEAMFAGSVEGTDRAMVILTDTVLFDPDLSQVIARCRRLRTAEDPVRICAAMTDENIVFQVDLFNTICNTPSASAYDPGQPTGVVSRVTALRQFQPICADCVAACVQTGGPDCDGDGVPDDCEPDCNGNGIADDCDLFDLPDADLNNNGVLDACEDDCNGNGLADFIDIENGTSPDCNGNAVPDECEGDEDCNGNGVPDFCDLAEGLFSDCNINGVPDECEQAVFGVVSHRVLALEGESPDLIGVHRDYGVLALGVAIHGDNIAWFGDVGDGGDPILGAGEQRRGRIVRFDLASGRFRQVIREGDLIEAPEDWLADDPAGCGELEAFIGLLPSDLPTLSGGPGDAAIRGVADDKSLLVRADISVESSLCDEIEDRGGLLRVGTGVTVPVFREGIDVCLLEEGIAVGSARSRHTGTYAQPEIQIDGSGLAWLVSRAHDGACFVARDGAPAPDGGVYATLSYSPGMFSPYQVVARHAGGGQTLFYARTSVSNRALLFDEAGVSRLVARDGTASNLPGQPAAPLTLGFSHEEGCDIGVLRGMETDVVFRARAGGVNGLFLWEQESNPIGGPGPPVVSPLVLESEIESLPGVDAAPGSVDFEHPLIGGPCGSCVGQPGIVVFKATWENAGDDEARVGLFAAVPGDGIHAVALPGRRLPPPRADLAYLDSASMLHDLEVDVNGSGKIVYSAFVGDPDAGEEVEPLSVVVLASVKPGACDVATPFGLLDLADITRFAQGLIAGDPGTDLAAPFGLYDLADVVAFVVCFTSGCP